MNRRLQPALGTALSFRTAFRRAHPSGWESQGFALLTVLWLVTALSAVVGLSLAATRLGQRTSVNRIHLARGRWAAEACVAIAQARRAQRRLADSATIDLGRATWCRWRTDDPSARVHLNAADREVLVRLLPDAESVIAHRPVLDLREVPGLDPALFTVDGPGVVNLSAAPPRVLLALPGMTPEAVERILARRAALRPIGSLDELAGLLSPAARGALLARYADLARLAVFAPPQLRITATGGVGAEALRATVELLVVPLPERLAIVRRRMW